MDEVGTRRLGSSLVVAQFTLIALSVVPLGPAVGSGQLRPLGLACLLLAGGIGLLALLAMGADTRVHPVPDHAARLHTHGIYSVIRHPMYAAVILACLGVALSSGRTLAITSWLVLLGVLHVKSRFEDRLLERKFGEEYTTYARRVPALIPQPWRRGDR